MTIDITHLMALDALAQRHGSGMRPEFRAALLASQGQQNAGPAVVAFPGRSHRAGPGQTMPATLPAGVTRLTQPHSTPARKVQP